MHVFENVAEWKRQIIYLLVYYSAGCSGLGWARLKTGTSSGCPMWVAGPQLSSVAFLGPLAGSQIGRGAAGTQLAPIWDTGNAAASYLMLQHWHQVVMFYLGKRKIKT